MKNNKTLFQFFYLTWKLKSVLNGGVDQKDVFCWLTEDVQTVEICLLKSKCISKAGPNGHWNDD